MKAWLRSERRSALPPAFPSKLTLALGIAFFASCSSNVTETPSTASGAQGVPFAETIPLAGPPMVLAPLRPGSEIICREEEVTGTRFAKRVCLTADEWGITRSKQRAQAQEYIRQTIENSAKVTPSETPHRGARLY